MRTPSKRQLQIIRQFDHILRQLDFPAMVGNQEGRWWEIGDIQMGQITLNEKFLAIEKLKRVALNNNERLGLDEKTIRSILEKDFANSIILKDTLEWMRSYMIDTLKILQKLRTHNPRHPRLAKLVFLEDEQMYYKTPVIFKTDWDYRAA